MPSGQRCWRTSAKHLASSNSPERLTRSDAGMIARAPCMKTAAAHHPIRSLARRLPAPPPLITPEANKSHNVNTIAALRQVVQRPRDLTRTQLRELRQELDRRGFSEANLRRAWSDAKNEEIAASIIGFVRQAALGDALIPYAERVNVAMKRIM